VQQVQDHANLNEAARKQRYDEINDILLNLEDQRNRVLADIDEARACKHPTGPLYTEKQRLEDEMDRYRKEKERCRPQAPAEPARPDFKENQVVLSTSAVGRNEAISNTSIVNNKP
jgi:hypothetical protein